MALHERWYYKVYHFFRYDIARFIKNIIRFRKELYEYYPWDSSYNMKFLKRSIELTADNIEQNGREVEESRNKKIKMMRRAVELLNNHIEDNFIEQAEKELGLKVVSKFDFVPCEDKPGMSDLVDKTTQEHQKNNKQIFTRSRELEEEQWQELWKIIQGQGSCPPDMDWDEFFNGSDLRGWWD